LGDPFLKVADNEESEEPEEEDTDNSEQGEEQETAQEEEDEKNQSADSSKEESSGVTSDSPEREADPSDKFYHTSATAANEHSKCPICGHRANSRFAQAISTHMRNRHSADEMRRITNNALKKRACTLQ